jgi:hypothetical protein
VRFHFQVRTDTHVMLTEVSELRDSNEARLDAAKRIGQLLQQHAGNLWADESWQMDVTNDQGLVLFVIFVQALRSPGTADMDQNGGG